jgi:hypothetical protein
MTDIAKFEKLIIPTIRRRFPKITVRDLVGGITLHLYAFRGEVKLELDYFEEALPVFNMSWDELNEKITEAIIKFSDWGKILDIEKYSKYKYNVIVDEHVKCSESENREIIKYQLLMNEI